MLVSCRVKNGLGVLLTAIWLEDSGYLNSILESLPWDFLDGNKLPETREHDPFD